MHAGSRLLIAALVGGLSGCMSIPISTMAKMASFDDADFLAIKPEEFRVKVQFDQDLDVDLDKTAFKLELGTTRGEFSRKAEFVVVERLDLKPEKAWYSLGFNAESESVLALDPAGLAVFKEVQGHIRDKTIKELRFHLLIRPKLGAIEGRDARMTVRLRLNPAEGYFTMFDAVDIEDEMDKAKAPAAG